MNDKVEQRGRKDREKTDGKLIDDFNIKIKKLCVTDRYVMY